MSSGLFDAHWHRQVDLLMPEVIELDVVGRFENLAGDFSAILHRLGAPQPVVDMATTVTNATTPIPLAAAFDSSLARRVYHHYLADFETYG